MSRKFKVRNVLDGSVRDVVVPGKPGSQATQQKPKPQPKPKAKTEPKGDAGGKDKR